MANDGRRKKILNGLVALVSSATGASYFYDYSGNGVVSLEIETMESRTRQSQGITIRIRDGAERHSRRGADAGVTANLDVKLRITIRAKADQLVTSMANAIADMILILGTNPNPGSPSTSCIIDSIEEPSYDFSNTIADCVMHLAAQYDYTAGIDT